MIVDARRTLPVVRCFHHPPDTPRRLKFWEIDKLFTCPTVGLCLTFSEQKQLLKRVGISIKKKSAFHIHEVLVASGCSQNRLSGRVDALLARKYACALQEFALLDDKNLMAKWNSSYAQGNYEEVFWAIACRPGLPVETRKAIFGDVHMAMHLNAEQRAEMKQKIMRHQQALADLSEKLRRSARHIRSLNNENQTLRLQEIALLDKLEASAKKQMELQSASDTSGLQEKIQSLEASNQQLQACLDAMTKRAAKSEKHAAVLEGKNKRLSNALDRYDNSHQQFETELKTILDDLKSMQRCSETCPSFDLCRKRVLVVGGITRMESLYRRLIEDNGGIFEYHDGHMKHGAKQLENRLRRAGMVLCPVNCNSHAACNTVKNLAKKLDKPLYMLANGSLNVVTQVIRGDCPDKLSIN